MVNFGPVRGILFTTDAYSDNSPSHIQAADGISRKLQRNIEIFCEPEKLLCVCWQAISKLNAQLQIISSFPFPVVILSRNLASYRMKIALDRWIIVEISSL